MGYRDADGLDLFGPAEVFAEAVRQLGAPVYELVMSTVGGGAMTLTSGISVAAADLTSIRPQANDIVIVAGGADEATDAAARNRALLGWLARASRTVSRLGSVCDGAFILASAGILDGRRAATHWYSCERLARLYPTINVDREAIFVRDGRNWTAAGVSTGIDMALAMVEEDHGRKLADTVAAHLVLFARRPGFQSQFSEELVAQTLASESPRTGHRVDAQRTSVPRSTWPRWRTGPGCRCARSIAAACRPSTSPRPSSSRSSGSSTRARC